MNVSRLMTPERLVGAVIWSLALAMIRGANMNPGMRPSVIELVADEIRITIEHLP